MKKFAIILGSFLLAGSLVACGEASVEKAEPADAEESTGSDEEEAKTETFKVGDTVKFDDLEITLTNVREAKDELMNPENDKFLSVELDIKNKADKSANISSLMQMNLMDADGYKMDIALVDGKGQLDGEIGPGRSMKGEVSYDVGDSDYYEFIFEDPFTNGQAIWKIDNEDVK